MNDKTDYDNINVKVIGVDFDGVLHDANDGWQEGKTYGAAMPGSKQVVNKLIHKGYEVVVCTARDNTEPVELWLEEKGFPKMRVTNKKIPCLAMIDDRAIRFTQWTDIEKYFV